MPTNYLLSANTTAIRKEGGWVAGTYSGVDAAQIVWPLGGLRFVATTTTVAAKMKRQGQIMVLHKWTGSAWTLVGRVTVPNDNTIADTSLFSGLSGATQYLLTCGGASCIVSYITVDSLDTTPLTERTYLAWYSDSIFRGTYYTSNDATLSAIFRVGLHYNLAVYDRGVDGRGVKQYVGSSPQTDSQAAEVATSDITLLSPAPAIVGIELGRNDVDQKAAIELSTTETYAEFSTAFVNTMTLLTGAPSLADTIFVVHSVFPSGAGQPSVWDQQIKNCVMKMNRLRGNANCKWVDNSTITGYDPSTDSIDGTHPKATSPVQDAIYNFIVGFYDGTGGRPLQSPEDALGAKLVTRYDGYDFAAMNALTTGLGSNMLGVDTSLMGKWEDSEGSGKDLLAAADDGTRATFFWTGGAAGVGKPGVRFDGVTQKLQALFALTQPEEVLLVWKTYSTTAEGGIWMDGGTAFMALQKNTTNVNAYAGQSFELDGRIDDAIVQHRVLFSGASSLQRNALAGVGTGNTGTQDAGGITFGGYARGATQYAKLDLHHVLVCNAALTEDERYDVEYYNYCTWEALVGEGIELTGDSGDGGGSGGGSTGSGEFPIDHDGGSGTASADCTFYIPYSNATGVGSSANVLQYTSNGTTGVEGLSVRAYLASAYDAGTRTVLATTRTLGGDNAGKWQSPLNLDPGTYYVIADAAGDGYQAYQFKIVVP